MEPRKLIVYIACSLDGYIAKPNDDLSFLDRVQKEGEDYGYHDFIANVDTVIIGRRTYDWVVKQVGFFPHSDKETYIITRTSKPAQDTINFYSGSLTELIFSLKSKKGKNIFCDGGAAIVNALLKENLIDEFIISVIPVLTGDGIRLFQNGRPEQALRLISAKSFETGLVQLHYQKFSE
ncbi:dihydrofolate reductase family protein [Robertkochia solimangrovi]|uniref:dihydrofolate reductase family protein n=1 Tax=Robertkochia solimangrovi TaxID=2213046 RepID=UPI00117FD3D2|nr:dihydrofolate reductase family protein [Robertkochia solimangrovi]TRZ46336.1 dihydrofolate reductase [Robertkochia solimangrovi]